MIRQQLEGPSTHGQAIEVLALLVAYRSLDERDYQVGLFRSEGPAPRVQIGHISGAGLSDLGAGGNFAGQDALNIGIDFSLVVRRFGNGRFLGRIQQRLNRASRRGICFNGASGLFQPGRCQAQLGAQCQGIRTQFLDGRPVRVFRHVLGSGLVGHTGHHLAALLAPFLFRSGELAFSLGQGLDGRLVYLVVGVHGAHCVADHVLPGQFTASGPFARARRSRALPAR